MTCIIREITGIPCPTCGVTRALLSLVSGNLKAYMYYNTFAVPLCIATVFMIFGTYMKKRSFQIISTIILLLNIPYYIYRLAEGLIP
ncbi:MAG: DUF2752 domain-containing protein [Treponema sp.]